MIFCQACGARNADEARFCNICGARIASTGEPGGPMASGGAVTQSEPPAPKTAPLPAPSTTTGGGTATTMSGSRVSLEAIGVRSSGRTYAILAGAAIALVALGAVGTWIAMRGGGEAAAPVAGGEADAGVAVDDEIVVGDPIPASEEMPEGVDIVTTGPRATKRGTSGGTSTTTTPRGSGGTGSSGTTAGTGSGGASGTSATGTGTSGSGGTSGTGGTPGTTAGTGGTAATGTGSTGTGTGSTGTGSTGTGSTGTGSAGTGSTGSAGTTGETGTRDWAAMEEDAPDERDLAEEGYSTHVRRVIREFYIRRAQTCFDHESARDGEAVRGTVLIGFTIEQSGEVVNTTVDRNTTGRDTLGACLARQVDQWRLPPPPTEMGDLDMQMPFSR